MAERGTEQGSALAPLAVIGDEGDIPGWAELPEQLRRAIMEAPPLSPDDPFASVLRGWLWGDPRPAEVPAVPAAA